MAESLSDTFSTLQNTPINDSIPDDEIWNKVRQAFTVNHQILNLNNGGISPQPELVQKALVRYTEMCNQGPTYFMWQVLDAGREPLRKKLARLANVDAEEIALNRNTTEALGTVTFGLSLSKDDEIVMSRQDHYHMVHCWKQREQRNGVTIKWINFELPIEDENVFVKAYIDATTSKTKVWHITHVINYTGQILPVKRLCEEAHRRGIKTIVDGAHAFALLSQTPGDFQCDYYGASLHKWLCAPFGTGLLHVKKENIGNLYPLFPSENPQSTNIRKFEELGGRSFCQEQAVSDAIDFHLAIGRERIEKRLRYLKDYWCNQVKNHPRIKLSTSLKSDFSCALGMFNIDGMEPDAVQAKLFDQYKIHTVSIHWANISGVRVTPHMYTLSTDLDRLCEAILAIANS